MRKNNKYLIIRESIKLFYTQGYNKTTIRQIAEACNMAHPSIFNHFKSKSEIGDVMFYRYIRGTAIMTQQYVTDNKLNVCLTHKGMVFYWTIHYYLMKKDSSYFNFVMEYYTFQKADEPIKRAYFEQLFHKFLPQGYDKAFEKKNVYTRLMIHAIHVLSLSYHEERITLEEAVIENFYMLYSIFKIERKISDIEISNFVQNLQIKKYLTPNLLENILLSDFGEPYQDLNIDNLFPT